MLQTLDLLNLMGSLKARGGTTDQYILILTVLYRGGQEGTVAVMRADMTDLLSVIKMYLGVT